MEMRALPANLPSVAALAYLGDAVHSLDIRRRAVAAGLSRSEDLHRFSTACVNARAQAAVYRALLPQLNEEEAALCRRAVNSRHLKHPKGASDGEYREATALEALLGYCAYLRDEARLQQLLDFSYDHMKGE